MFNRETFSSPFLATARQRFRSATLDLAQDLKQLKGVDDVGAEAGAIVPSDSGSRGEVAATTPPRKTSSMGDALAKTVQFAASKDGLKDPFASPAATPRLSTADEARPALLRSSANFHAPSPARMSHSACYPTSASSHCRASLRLPLPPALRSFLTRQFLWRQAKSKLVFMTGWLRKKGRKRRNWNQR